MADRIIFHIDVNSAFLSWEAVKRLSLGDTVDLRTIPSAIGGDEKSRHGVVLAKSVPAKAFGVTTGESLFSARQKCPDLVVAPSDFPLYTEMSRKLMAFLAEYSPLIEQFSIDECFLDFTGLEKLYGEPVKAAYDLKDKIKETFGFTVNIGVAQNKIMAKMAGELKKPDMVHTMFPHELQDKLWPMPVRELFMVGVKTEKVLLSYGIDTIGKLANANPELIGAVLKSHGLMLMRYANGIDNSPVSPTPVRKGGKSFSCSSTLSADAITKEECALAILKLCQSACMRMRKEGYACSNVSVQIKYSDFSVFGKQMHLKSPTSSTEAIYGFACSVFDALWTGQPVRLLGVALSELTEAENDQISIFENMEKEKHKKLDSVCDAIRKKFGNHSISYGAELSGEDFHHLDRFFPENMKKSREKERP